MPSLKALLSVLASFCISDFRMFNHVVFEFKSLSNFYIDSFGMFYLSQYAILFGYCIPILLLLISILRAVDGLRAGRQT
jgi:hypothetical protein